DAVAPAPAQPSEPFAERRFQEWLAAFTAGDREKLVAFHDRYFPIKEGVPGIDEQLAFFGVTGGFEIKKIVSSTPVRVEALVKENASDQFARAVIEVEAAEP